MESKRRYAGFDIETVKITPEGEEWQDHRPLGIACGVLWLTGEGQPQTWYGRTPEGEIAERMSPPEAREMVRELTRAVSNGYTLVTWNGVGFDLDVLAEESGAHGACRSMAMDHVDMMFHVVCHFGYRLSLKAACEGSGTQGKTQGMDGRAALSMWHDGQRQEVIDYCRQDARATLELAEKTESDGRMQWISRSGRRNTLQLPQGWLSVRDAFELPSPETGWMTDPVRRESMTRWLGT